MMRKFLKAANFTLSLLLEMVKVKKQGVAKSTCNPSTLETEARGSGVQGQLDYLVRCYLQREIMF
jgi:hypothetical protein